MLPFAARCRLNLNPGEFAIQTIDHAEDQRDDETSGEMAGCETDCPENPEQKAKHSDLIGRNACPAQMGDDECFDRRMYIGGNIERAILG